MNELELQDKYLINFLCDRQDGLGYKEVKPNKKLRKMLINDEITGKIKVTEE